MTNLPFVPSIHEGDLQKASSKALSLDRVRVGSGLIRYILIGMITHLYAGSPSGLRRVGLSGS